MHIVFVCNELPPAPSGGIGHFVKTMADSLKSQGHKITVVGVYDKLYDWDDKSIEIAPITSIYPSFWRRGRRLIHHLHMRRLAIYQKLRAINKISPIDIIEWPDFEGLYWRNIAGTTNILRTHGTVLGQRALNLHPVAPLIEKLEINTLSTIPNWIGNSNWYSQFLINQCSVRPSNLKIIYNPIDTQLFKPSLHREANFVLYAGSLIKRKGVLSLAKSANTFLRLFPDTRLIFAGKEMETTVQDIYAIISPELREQVLILHSMPQTELARLMQKATIFAMPSMIESFGNVWAEAMSCGVPVIGSKFTCGPEIVPDGNAGILVNPEDENEISNAIIKLLSNPSLRNRMGNEGRKHVEANYSLETVTDQTLQFYQACRN